MVKMLLISLVILGCNDKVAMPAQQEPAAAAPQPTTDPAPVEQPQPAPPLAPVAGAVVAVTALGLIKDYKADDIDADDKYRNRALLVTGKVSAVDKDTLGMDDPGIVMFETASGSVQAKVGAASKALKAGQHVKLKCTGDGFEADTALLVDCTVQR